VRAVKYFRSYPYGHGSDVYTDHEALKYLLNTPQPSDRLGRWEMALQELDLHQFALQAAWEELILMLMHCLNML